MRGLLLLFLGALGSGCCFAGVPDSVCDEACAAFGQCAVRTEHAGDSGYRCYAASDEGCRASAACRDEGSCFASEDGSCVAEAALESHRCAQSEGCRLFGGCHPSEGFCVAAGDEDCRASLECLTQGRCSDDDGLCLVGDSDCRATTGCALEGTCTTQRTPLAILGVGPTCALTESGDCTHTEACRRDGRCVARPIEGCSGADHCYLFYCARPEDAYGVTPCTEEPSGGLSVCAPDGRCMRDASGVCRHLDAPPGLTLPTPTLPIPTLPTPTLPTPTLPTPTLPTPTLPTPTLPTPTVPSMPPTQNPPSSGAAIHPHALVSFALSSDGTQLATGSGCGETGDFEAPIVGVVLWDVASGSMARSVPVEGGVGLDNPLRRGLRYASDGRSLGFNGFTNQVGVLDPRTGDVSFEAEASVEDHAPSFALEGSGRLYVHPSEPCPGPAMGALFSRGTGRLEACVTGRLSGAAEVVSFRAGVIHLVDRGVLYAITTQGEERHRTPLFTGGGRIEVWPSPSGRRVAATLEGGGVTVLDVDDHHRAFSGESPASSGVIFDGVERRFAAVGPDSITVFAEDRVVGTVAGPFAARDWLRFADGVPAAFSPDGRHLAALRPDGTLVRWALDPHPHPERSLPAIEGASALLWPSSEVLIALGAERLTFLRSDGSVIADYRFPR